MFEVPAGGRRFRALELLVKQKRLAKTAPVPCVVREGGIAEEDSLAENVQRAPLHPLDQFRAFLVLREKGQAEEEIAATFFVSVNVIKQRLKLASVSPVLLDVYAEDGMTLAQLEAFTVSGDHARQEQVLERLKTSYDKSAYAIRRMLTEGAVRATDKRALFIGIEAYVEAGGSVLRDLFEGDDGGWLQDVALIDKMVADKLSSESEAVAAEGWKWTEVAPDFAYGHTYGLRRLHGEPVPLTAEEEATRDALKVEFDRLVSEHEGADELPDEVDERLGELETALEAFEERPLFGRAKSAADFLYLFVGDGVGGAIVRGGELQRGYRGNAGEFGHVIVDPAGPLCHCGNRGCLYTYLSTAGLRPRSKQSAAVDKATRSWVANAIPALRSAVVSLENGFDPERIIIGGTAPVQLLKALVDDLHPLGPSIRSDSPERVEVSELGPTSALLGAAALPLLSLMSPSAAKLTKQSLAPAN